MDAVQGKAVMEAFVTTVEGGEPVPVPVDFLRAGLKVERPHVFTFQEIPSPRDQ